MHPSDILSDALMRWVLTAKAMERRALSIYKELEKVKDENPKRAGRLMKILMDFAVSVPEIVNI